MRQFDVCPYRDRSGTTRVPFVCILQHDFLEDLRTVVVAPLQKKEIITEISRLTPIVDIARERYVLMIPDLAGLDRRMLSGPIANLQDERDRIIAAIDMLFTGF